MTKLLACWLFALSAHALIIPGGDDSTHTNTPPGSLSTPWACVGYWQGCAGTAISPHHFIAAAHIGGCIGDWFHMPKGDGTYDRYLVMNGWHDEFSDTSVWLVLGTFPHWTNLNGESRLASTNALVVGAGVIRGEPIYAETVATNWMTFMGTRVSALVPSTRLAGYGWTGPRGALRWGVNRVMEGPGDMVMLPFETCGVGVGDSSGPVFIERGGEWLLTGILYGVSGSGPYSTRPNQPAPRACYWNFADLYDGNYRWPNNGVYATTAFATAIAPRITWILGILDL